MLNRHDRMKELLQHLAAEFLNRQSNRTTLITVTDINLTKDARSATILISVFPKDKTKGALDFVRRKRRDLGEYIKTHSRLKRLPRFDFDIDHSEQNRQHLDKLLNI
ncbi:ribosome-binding factor A [Patescibacteria group bacterium]|nr:ribosome-binding factor A [Patescibacteria group bacterium]